MARVTAPFRLRGSIGGLTFFENEYGPQAKEKAGPREWHMKNSESFQKALRNAAEWQRVTKGAQLLRRAMSNNLLKGVNNMRLSGRMNASLLKALHADTVHGWGEREIAWGDLSKVVGFEFNNKLPLDEALPLNVDNCYTVGLDKICLQVPAFRLRKKKGLPSTATHYRMVSVVLTVDFNNKVSTRAIQASPLQAMGRKSGDAFSAEHILPDKHPGCFWLVGIEFYEMEDGHPKLLKGGALRVMHWVEGACEEEVVEAQQSAEPLQVVEQPAQAVTETVMAATPSFIMVTPRQVVERKVCLPCEMTQPLFQQINSLRSFPHHTYPRSCVVNLHT